MKSSNQNYNNFAIRGVVEGIKKVKPSIDFIIKQDKKSDPACGKCQVYDADIRIEPKLFKRYGIQKARAVVYDKERGDRGKVYGDMSYEFGVFDIKV